MDGLIFQVFPDHMLAFQLLVHSTVLSSIADDL